MKKILLISIVLLLAMTQFVSAISHDLYWVDDASDAKTVMQGTSLSFTYETYTTAGQNFGEDHTVQTTVKLYRATDSNNPLSTLVDETSQWFNNGSKTVSTSSLSEGDYVIHGLAYDLDDIRNGAPRRDADILYFTVVEPNIDPSVATVFIKPDAPYNNDDLKGYCKATDANGDSITYYGQWIRNGEFYKSASLANQQAGKPVIVDTLSSDLTRVNEQWVFACQANDGTVTTPFVYSDPVTIRAIPVPNSAPTITSLWISPQNPTDAQDIAGFCKPYDADGDSLSVEYQWLVDGQAYTTTQSKNNQASGSTVAIGNYDQSKTSAHQEWTVKCRAYDGEEYSAWKYASVSIQEVIIPNTAPVMQTVYINPSEPFNDDYFSAYCKASDADNDDLVYEYKWHKDSVFVTQGTSPSHAQGGPFRVSTIEASTTTAGEVWKVSCRAYDGEEYSAWKYASVSIQEVIVPNVAPVMQTVYIDPSEPFDNQDLSGYCKANDNDYDDLVYEFKWYKDNSVVAQGTSNSFSPGSTAKVSTIDDGATQADEQWKLACRAYDGEEYSAWKTSSVVVIQEVVIPNKAPCMKEVYITPNTPYDNEDLSGFCKANDVDGDNLAYEFKWYKDEYFFASGSTNYNQQSTSVKVGDIASSFTTAGEAWKLACRAYDGEAYSNWKTSSAVVIKEVIIPNVAPVMNTVRITPASPFDTDDLTGYCKGSDADNDDIVYTFQWLQNGVVKVYGTSTPQQSGDEVHVSTVGDVLTRANDEWQLRCKAYDGQEYSSWKYSNTVVIKEVVIPNVAPVMNSVYITPSLPFTEDDLSGFCRADDADDDTVQYEFVWYVDGVVARQDTTSFFTEGVVRKLGEIDAQETSVHQEWQLKCRAYDGEDYSAWKTSDKVVIQELIIPNLPPIMYEVSISPNQPLESQDVSGLCRAGDQDSENLYYNIVWLQNGETVGTFDVGPYPQNTAIDAATVLASQTVQDDVWQLGCQAYDGEEYSLWMYSNEVVIRDDGCLDNPLANIAGPATALVGDTKQFNGLDSQASHCGIIETYDWFIQLPQGSNQAIGANSPQLSYEFSQVGVYTLALVVTDSEGKSATATKPITVTKPYVATPTAVITAPTTVQTGTEFLVSGKNSYAPDGETIVSYVWTLVDQDNIHLSSYNLVWDTFNFDEVGQYTYTLTVTASNGETDTTSHTVMVTQGEEEEEDNNAYNGLRIVSYTMYGHDVERVAPGETLVVRVKVYNARDTDIEDLRLAFIEPQLGLRYKSGAIDLDSGETDTFILKIDIPHYMEYGYYYPALSFTSDDVRRVKYGYMEVTEA